jgi:mRNA-degrading endonuclease toxin of MazEF toxin-antitoxin module
MTDMIRSVSQERLVHRLGLLGPHAVAEIEDRLRVLLAL